MKRLYLVTLALLLLVAVTEAKPIKSVILSVLSPVETTVFTSGNLAITMDRGNGDTTPGPLFYPTVGAGQTPDGTLGLLPTGLWAPGDTHHRVMVVRNMGSLDASLQSVQAVLSSGSRRLADKMQVRVTRDAAGTDLVTWGSLGQFLDVPQLFTPGPIDLAVGNSVELHLWVTLPLDADNSYQNLRLVASFGVQAEQKRNNTPPKPPEKPPQLG